MESSFLTRDQALSLWSGITDSKSLGYQRTNHGEYQIVRTHTKEPLEYKTQDHPSTSPTLCRTPHLNNKKNTNPIISRQDYYLTQLCSSEEKQTKTQHTSHPIWNLHRHFSKEDIQMTNKYMKRCSTSLIIREIQIKTTMRYHLTTFRFAIIKKATDNKFWKGCREKGKLLRCWECKLI